MAYQDELLSYAGSKGPFDSLTRQIHHPVLTIVMKLPSLPLLPIQVVSTFILGLGVSLTFGLLLFPLSLLWHPFVGVLLSTSWLWIKIPFLRPVLFSPGAIFAGLAGGFAACMPEMGERDARAMKQALCESWPHSFHLLRISQQDRVPSAPE